MDFTKMADDMKTLFHQLFDAKIKEGEVDYVGIDVTTPHILTTCFNIKDNFSQLEYHKGQNRDKLDLFIMSVFHLGFQGGVERMDEKLELLRFNNESMTKIMKFQDKTLKTNTLSVGDVKSMLPTDAETEVYANNSFGFDGGAYEKEQAFIQGVEWARDEMNRKLEKK